MPYWNFDYTKAVTLHCGKSGRWCRSCNWGNPFWVKSTSNFLLWCSQCNHTVVKTTNLFLQLVPSILLCASDCGATLRGQWLVKCDNCLFLPKHTDREVYFSTNVLQLLFSASSSSEYIWTHWGYTELHLPFVDQIINLTLILIISSRTWIIHALYSDHDVYQNN